jgi:hypothetical protein
MTTNQKTPINMTAICALFAVPILVRVIYSKMVQIASALTRP